MSNIEKQFHQEMLNIYKEAKAHCKYNATRFLQMVEEHGGVKAAKKLLDTPEPQEGLFKLWECKRLDISMEALVLREEYRSLFSKDELDNAQTRLQKLKYFVDL